MAETVPGGLSVANDVIADMAGYAALESKTVQRTLQRMRAVGGDVRREDVIRRLCALAFAPVNDAIRLAYLDDPGEAAVARLDLSPVAEFRAKAYSTTVPSPDTSWVSKAETVARLVVWKTTGMPSSSTAL